MIVAIAITWSFKLADDTPIDFTFSVDWPAPVRAEEPAPNDGPVMASIEYRIQAGRQAEFVPATPSVREMRRRNGTYFREVFHDSADLANHRGSRLKRQQRARPKRHRWKYLIGEAAIPE